MTADVRYELDRDVETAVVSIVNSKEAVLCMARSPAASRQIRDAMRLAALVDDIVLALRVGMVSASRKDAKRMDELLDKIRDILLVRGTP